MSARWSVLAFGVGVVLAVALQSSSTVAVIAISMSAAGLFTLDQAMLTVFGASVGSGLSTYIVSAGMEGSSRQLAILQATVKILGVGVLLPLVIVERTCSRSAAGGAHSPDHQRYRQTGGARLSRLPGRRRRGAGGLRPRP